MEADSFLKVVQTVGVPVAICLAMLFAFGKWIIHQDDKYEKKDELRHTQHREERAQDRESHIVALKEITGRFDTHTNTLQEVHESVKDLVREVKGNGGRS